MRILSFNIPQVKQQIFLYIFAECSPVRILMVDPVNPQASSGDSFLRYEWSLFFV